MAGNKDYDAFSPRSLAVQVTINSQISKISQTQLLDFKKGEIY